MNVIVELKNFYPFLVKERELRGSLHVSVTVEGVEIQLRGIVVTKRGADKYFCRYPLGKGTDHETGDTVYYPILKFSNEEVGREVLDQVYKLVPPFVDAFMKTYQAPVKMIDKGSDAKPSSVDNVNRELPSHQLEFSFNAEAQKKQVGIGRLKQESEQLSEQLVKARIKEREYITPPPLKKRAYSSSGRN